MKIVIGCVLVFCIFAAAHGKINRRNYIIFSKHLSKSSAQQANSINAHKLLPGNNSAMSIDSMSFLVSVRRDNKHICQGSILDNSLVVVPAHCVECESESNLDSFEVLAGTNKINNASSGILYKVSDISCNELDPNDNMAVLKLSNNITTNQRTIGLGVSRENDNVTAKVSHKKYIVGWKRVEGKNFSEIERKEVPILPETCSKIFKELSLSPNNYLCTTKSKYNVCEGNSDHVLISDDKIIGIPTKIGCGMEGKKYNIFTRLESITVK